MKNKDNKIIYYQFKHKIKMKMIKLHNKRIMKKLKETNISRMVR